MLAFILYLWFNKSHQITKKSQTSDRRDFYSTSEVIMNIKANIVKSMGFVGVVSALTAAYAFTQANKEPVTVAAPFKVESIDPENEQAVLQTANEKFTLEVDFDAQYSIDGNGYQAWREVEINEIKDIRVYDEDGEVLAYVDRLDVVEIKVLIESGIRERI